jgi:2-polyprenyl-6-methoxyphenol hydroxylase-like FAD-dependent oxidoreductase
VTTEKFAEVVGSGVAGLSAARMLSRNGWLLRMTPSEQALRRWIALNDAAKFLLEKIWGEELFSGLRAHRLTRRIVAWSAPQPACIEQHFIVTDVADLVARMHWLLRPVALYAESTGADPFRIVTGGVEASDGFAPMLVIGGTRRAAQLPVVVSAAFDPHALLIEACAEGWMALLPTGEDEATLIAVSVGGLPVDRMLAASRYTSRLVAAVEVDGQTALSAPHLRLPPHDGASSLYAGHAAIAFDPISGDGAATSLRTAHLAALSLEASANGADMCALRAFYDYRLRRAMAAHLEGLAKLYGDAPFRRDWAVELAANEAMSEIVGKSIKPPQAMFAIGENCLSLPLATSFPQ